MRESPTRSTRRRWVRRPERRGAGPAGEPLRLDPERPILAVHREEGEWLGAYETRYDVRRGYAEDRTIIQP